MTSKMQEYMNQILAMVKEPERAIFKELSDFCEEQGLKPKKVSKKNVLAMDFLNPTRKYAILRLGVDEMQQLIVELRYYATKDYSQKFHDAIRAIIDSYKGEYVGCYQCGNCQGQYIYHHPDGTDYIRCGFAFVPIPSLELEDVPEIKRLIVNQNRLFEEQGALQ